MTLNEILEEIFRRIRDECNRALTELEVDRIAAEQGKAIEGQLAAVKAEAKTCPGCGTNSWMASISWACATSAPRATGL